MKTSSSILIILSLILLISCLSGNKNDKLERISIDHLSGDMIEMETLTRLVDPFAPDIYMLNDSLLILTFYRDASLIRIYNINSGELESHRIRSEKDSFRISEDKNLTAQFNLLHQANNVFYEYIVEEGIFKLNNFTRLRMGKNSPYEAVKADENIFLGLGSYKQGLMAMINTQTKLIDHYGNYPLSEDRYIYKNYLENYKGYLDREGDDIIYASRYFGYISSYQYKKGKIKKNWEKQLTDYVFQEKLTSLQLDSTHCYGFQGVIVKKDHIYGLYAGYASNSRREFRNSLLIFDRLGTPVAHYPFPDMMQYIAIDDKEEYVYATYSPYMNQSWLVRFRLPSSKGTTL